MGPGKILNARVQNLQVLEIQEELAHTIQVALVVR